MGWVANSNVWALLLVLNRRRWVRQDLITECVYAQILSTGVFFNFGARRYMDFYIFYCNSFVFCFNSYIYHFPRRVHVFSIIQVYEPTIFENYVYDFTIDDHDISLSLWDTAGTSIILPALPFLLPR